MKLFPVIERAGVTCHLKWLIDRIEWLKYEMDQGGDWKYLNEKREETAYCLEKLRAHIPALERCKHERISEDRNGNPVCSACGEEL